jgi:hypothetical protein
MRNVSRITRLTFGSSLVTPIHSFLAPGAINFRASAHVLLKTMRTHAASLALGLFLYFARRAFEC